jgi:hypothetical protein
MAGISVQKGNSQVEISHTLIDETKKLSEGWGNKSHQQIAKMLCRAIPGYHMVGETQFTLTMNIPGGKMAKLPLETFKNGSPFNIIDLIPGKKIHIC